MLRCLTVSLSPPCLPSLHIFIHNLYLCNYCLCYEGGIVEGGSSPYANGSAEEVF